MLNERNTLLEDDGIEEEILVEEECSVAQAVWGDILGNIENQTDLQNALDAKQDSLTEAQLSAVNSGITSEKVTTYDGYADQIASKADQSALNAESIARGEADTALGTRIDNEALARQSADNGLQTQIDAITSKSDVVDVVANYAALQAYDTSTLGNNDVVKVLDDETHEDAMTYYRWNKTAGTWSYIGSEAPYYSKGQMDTMLQAKQDKLIAGTNIQIAQDGKTISATDTTYTAGNGLNLNGTEFSADTDVLATKEDLESYYTKPETDNLLAPKLEAEAVAELPTTGEEGRLYLTPKAHTTSTATGNPIEATVTEQAGQLESFQLDGDTFQQTYTGQNLYNVATLQTGTNVTKDDDGWITVTRDNSSGSSASYTNIWTDNLNLDTDTQYAIVVEIKAASGTGELDITSTNATQGQFSSWQSRQVASLVAGQVFKVTPTTKSSFSGIYGGLRTVLILQAGQSASVTFRLSVLANASVAPSGFVYEPYVGGQPSPSPDYPQPIQTVTGLQTITINGTDYPLYLGTIELCGLGDDGAGGFLYKDRIYRDGDDWKVHKETKTIYLKDITWLAAPTSVSGKYRMRTSTAPDDILAPADNNTKAVIKSSVYDVITAGGTYAANATGISVQASTPHIFIYDPNYNTSTSPTSFTQKMASTNATAYYALATATDTTITDTALIAQLEAIRTASLQNGANTITNTATGSNLAGDMEIGYYGFNPRNRYDKFIWLDINNNYEQIGS